jgi:hypothetical protein
MRVLHLDGGREMRGGQWQVVYLIEELRRREYSVELLCPEQSPLFVECRTRGISAEGLSLRALRNASSRFDLVHAHDSRSHTLAAVASRRPFVVSRRVAFPVKRNPLSRWKYSRAGHYLAISGFVRQTLVDARVPEAKISVVTDATPLAPNTARPEHFRLLAIDFDDPRKGTNLAREAAQLAGLTLALTRNLETDMPDASAFLYLTHSEGLGSAILMAMAHGVPVIASRVGGIPEIVIDGETGLLVENHPAEVAAAITRVQGDPLFAARLGRNARRTIEAGFTPRHMADKTIRVYEQVLKC